MFCPRGGPLKNILKIVGIVCIFFGGIPEILANGLVKGANEYYFKLNYSMTDNTFETEGEDNLDFDEDMRSFTLYAEYGLSLFPWNSQLIMNTARKTIERTGHDLIDSHKTSGLTDTEITLKHKIGSKQFESFPLNINVAAKTGYIAPTTKKKFRTNRETERADEVPEGRETLIASIDRGKQAYLYGLGISFYLSPVWLNISHSTRSQADSEYQVLIFESSLGVGLPFNSWLQVNSTQSKIPGNIVGASDKSIRTQTLWQYGASFGLTVWQGLAVELGYRDDRNSDDRWERGRTYEAGLSYRSL
jgi:hypothetical protein